jgi:N-acetylglutamate synthase-like GNAT family acetyltransferase
MPCRRGWRPSTNSSGRGTSPGAASESSCAWLDAALRRGGLGCGVIALAEAEARQHGCHSAYVDTFSFQAPEFYRKQGYVEFGRLAYPPQGERLFLRKSLA